MLNLSRIVSKEFLTSSTTTTTLTIIQYLPDELILSIFSFLSDKSLLQASVVCKHWNELANDPTLWHGLYIRRIKLETSAIVSESSKKNKKNEIELQDLHQAHELELEHVIEEQFNSEIDWKEEYYNKIRSIETTDPYAFYRKGEPHQFPRLVKWSGKVVSVFIRHDDVAKPKFREYAEAAFVNASDHLLLVEAYSEEHNSFFPLPLLLFLRKSKAALYRQELCYLQRGDIIQFVARFWQPPDTYMMEAPPKLVSLQTVQSVSRYLLPPPRKFYHSGIMHYFRVKSESPQWYDLPQSIYPAIFMALLFFPFLFCVMFGVDYSWVEKLSLYLLVAQFLAMFVLTPKPSENLPTIVSTIVFGIIKFTTSWEKLVPLNLFCLMMLLWFHSLKSSYGGISLLTHPTVRYKSEQLRSVVLLIYGPFLVYFLSSSLLFFIKICDNLLTDASPIYPVSMVQYWMLMYWASRHHPLLSKIMEFKKVRAALLWFAVAAFFFNIGRVMIEMGMYFVYWAHYSELVQVDIGLWGLVPKVAREIFVSDILPLYRKLKFGPPAIFRPFQRLPGLTAVFRYFWPARTTPPPKRVVKEQNPMYKSYKKKDFLLRNPKNMKNRKLVY